HHHVVGRIVRVGAAMPETRGRGIDEARIALVQAIPAIAELLHRARAEVFDERVGLVEQPLEDLAAVGRFEVERDRFLAAIDRYEIGGFAVLERTVLAGVITLLRRLDPDHSGAELGGPERAGRTPEGAGKGGE